MEIKKISVDRFNNLAFAEPDASIYQHSCWADHMVGKDYDPLFVEYDDDHGVCQALAMFLLKRESFFSSKLTAFCLNGYLINYFDLQLLRSFNQELIPFLRQQNIKKLVIEPTVYYSEGRFDNHAIADALLDLGYSRSGDLFTYQIDTRRYEQNKGVRNIVLKFKEVEENSDEYQKLFGQKEDENVELYKTLQPYTHIYAVRLDSFKSKRALEEDMQECIDFIVRNKEDYKFNEQIAEKEAQIANIKAVTSIVRKYEKNGEDPIMAAACVAFYSNKCIVLFEINKDRENALKGVNILFDRIAEEARSRGCSLVEGRQPFANAQEKKLLGEFTYIL